MTSVIFTTHRKSLQNSDILLQENYRSALLDLSSAATACATSEDRLLSGRSSVQLRPGAPKSATCAVSNPDIVCNRGVLSVISAGDPVTFAHPKGDRPALYVAPYGLRHVIQTWFKGKPMLVYVPARAIRPATDSTAEHS